ncbi:MAG: hypothetical protein IJ764_07840 [Bacteroidales bacterium]|nr:hypothetical protein [Bacteroidales bacterium]
MGYLRKQLSERIHKGAIDEICLTMDDDKCKAELWALLFDGDKRTSDNAAWVFSHFSVIQRVWLNDKQNELMDEIMRTESITKRRLMLSLIESQSFEEKNIRTDFLDFCLSQLSDPEIPSGIRALCIKMAHKQCRHYSELLKELQVQLEYLQPTELQPGLRHTRNSIMRKIAEELRA